MKKRRRKEKSHNALWAAASIAIILIYKMLKSKEQPALASERPPKNISVPKSQEAMSKVGQTKDKALHETEVSCASVVAKIRQLKIELVAIDFDNTIIDIHTGGRWDGTADELKQNVRLEFSECLFQHNLPLAVATFSRQEDLIRQVTGINAVFGGMDRHSEAGKRNHIERAVKASGRQIENENILLIDDDVDNIEIAQNDGMRVITFSLRHPHRMFEDILDLQ